MLLAVIEKVMVLQIRSAAVHTLTSLSHKGSISAHFLTLGSASIRAAALSVIHLPESRNPAGFTACIRSLGCSPP